MGNLNCWEIMKCGRESGGSKADEMGECPASLDTSSDGMNHGKNGGRICWAIAGTYCGCDVQGDFAQKKVSCMDCVVFEQIRDEEKAYFTLMHPWQAYMSSD